MTVALERYAEEILGPGASAAEAERWIAVWEDLLTLVVEPETGSLRRPDEARALLPQLLHAAGLSEERFWALPRSQRSRLFLSHFSRNSRDIPDLEISAFDLDKLVKERFRREPLTLGAAWHYGLWRSYFSHAAITHPANDGLREEFSTAWQILRKEPAAVWREPGGRRVADLKRIRLDLPMLIGPLPYGDGHTLERAYLRAIEAADPAKDLKTRSLVVVRAETLLQEAESLGPFAPHLLPRFRPEDLERLFAGGEEAARWGELLARTRIAELHWHEGLHADAERLLERWPHLLLSVSLRYSGGFWRALEDSVATPGVALVQVWSARRKSYRLVPQVDAFLKNRLVRARVQLVLGQRRLGGGRLIPVVTSSAISAVVLLATRAATESWPSGVRAVVVVGLAGVVYLVASYVTGVGPAREAVAALRRE